MDEDKKHHLLKEVDLKEKYCVVDVPTKEPNCDEEPDMPCGVMPCSLLNNVASLACTLWGLFL